MAGFDPQLRSPKEHSLFVLGAIFSAMFWLMLAISIVGLFYGLAIGVFVLAGHALFLAHVRGNGVRLSERQLPELYARVKAAAAKLGMDEVPDVYVVQAGGTLNAFATKLLSRRFVVVFSDLVDHCHDVRHLDFVIGHELAHLAAGHLKWNAFLIPFRLVPWLGAAYSRACEYTCDRAGYRVVGELEPALRGLCVLAAGGRVAAHVNLSVFAEQQRESGGFWMATLELVSSHPFLCKRVAALQELVHPGSQPVASRSPLAWMFAPMLGGLVGGGAAGAMVPIAIVGILASVAIPSFANYVERTREAEAAAAVDRAAEPAADAEAHAGADDDEGADDEAEADELP